MNKQTLNIGMIGAGFIGQLAHLSNYSQVNQCKITALAELRPILRERVAQHYRIPRSYGSHKELLNDPEIDAVVIVTPRPYTGPVTLDCLQAGFHVLSEKPMAASVQQGKTLVDQAIKNKVHYVVGYMKRYDEGVQVAKQIYDELISTKELGPVQFVRAHCYMGNSYCNLDGHIVTDENTYYEDEGWPICPDWIPDNLSSDYAAFTNTYSHNVNLLRYFFGVTPTVEYARFGQQSGNIAVLNFGDFIASLETGRSTNRDWDETLDIYFLDGHLSVKTPPALLKNIPAKVILYKAGKHQAIYSPLCDWTWSFRRQAEAFVNTIIENGLSISSGSDSLEDLKLIEEMWHKAI